MKSPKCSVMLDSRIGRLWPCFLALAVLLVGAPARAECFTLATAPLDADCVVMAHGETRGVWFRLDKADELRKLSLEAPELRLQVAKQDDALRLRDEQVGLFRESIAIQRTVAEQLKVEAETLVRTARRANADATEARAERDAWYRSPYLWFAAGAIVSGVACVAITVSVTD